MTDSIYQRISADATGNFPMDGLRYLLIGYREESREEFYDCDAALEAGVRQMRQFGRTPRRGRDELAELLALDLSDFDLARRTIWPDLPAGGSTHEFLRYVLTRVDAELAHPAVLDADLGRIDDRAQPMAHRSRFPDKDTAEEATTLVLRAHEDRFRSWAADQQGVARLWLAADLGRPIGWVTPWPRRAQLDRGEPLPPRIETSTCVAVLRMEESVDRPVVLASYPELPLDPAVRERWPDLTALLGGYFNQDTVQLNGSFWDAERAFNELSSPEVIARVADSLDRLLAEGQTHPELRETLHSLGSCTLPDDTVRWVTGLHRRMTQIDWHATPVFPTHDDVAAGRAGPLPPGWTHIPGPGQ